MPLPFARLNQNDRLTYEQEYFFEDHLSQSETIIIIITFTIRIHWLTQMLLQSRGGSHHQLSPRSAASIASSKSPDSNYSISLAPNQTTAFTEPSFLPTLYTLLDNSKSKTQPSSPSSTQDTHQAPVAVVVVHIVLLSIVLGAAFWFCWWAKRHPWKSNAVTKRSDAVVRNAGEV